MAEKPRLRHIDSFPVEVSGRKMIGIRDPEGYTDKILCLAPESYYLLTYMNGRNTVRDIQTAFMRQFGVMIYTDQIEEILGQLDKYYFLENNHFHDHVNRLKQEFSEKPVRESALAGNAYPAEIDELIPFLDNAYHDKDNENLSPVPEGKTIKGILAPHIDLNVGLSCYGYAYYDMDPGKPADLYIILGTAHAGAETPFIATRKDFRTVLGTARTDSDFIDRLEKLYGCTLTGDEISHRSEHSVEFQVIFLQHKLGCQRRSTNTHPVIVPVLCGSFHHVIQEHRYPEDDPEIEDFLEAFRVAIRESGKKTCIIASADLAHIGLRFGSDMAPSRFILESLEQKDREMLIHVENIDPEKFYDNVAREMDSRNICGLASIYTMLKTLDGCTGKIRKYQQWHDVAGGSAVTFASGVFYG